MLDPSELGLFLGDRVIGSLRIVQQRIQVTVNDHVLLSVGIGDE